MLTFAIRLQCDIGRQPTIFPSGVKDQEPVFWVEDWISSDSSPFVRAVPPLSSSDIQPDVHTVIESIVVEVNIRHVGILDQISNIRSVHCISVIRDCPSYVVVIWVDSPVPSKGSSEPNKENVIVGILNGGAR